MTRDPHRGPTQGTHTQRGPTQGTHTGDLHRGPTQGTHTEGRAPQRTHHRRGGPHRGPTQNTHRQFRRVSQVDSVPRHTPRPCEGEGGVRSPLSLLCFSLCRPAQADGGWRAVCYGAPTSERGKKGRERGGELSGLGSGFRVRG